MSNTVPIKLAPPLTKKVTGDEVQGWADSLSERDAGFLRVCMEHCVLQGRSQALADAVDVALRAQQACKPKSGAREIATKIVSALMQGRMKTLEEMKAKGFG